MLQKPCNFNICLWLVLEIPLNDLTYLNCQQQLINQDVDNFESHKFEKKNISQINTVVPIGINESLSCVQLILS